MSGLGLAGLLAPSLNFHFDDPFATQQGRVTTRTVWVYKLPSKDAEKVRFYQRDTVLSINNTAVSDDLEAHILENEEEHVDTLETQFEMIRQMGIENYIQLQSRPTGD